MPRRVGANPPTGINNNQDSPDMATIASPPLIIPDTPSSASALALKTRRSHRKSRNGCAECKRRHIRCDERRPNCSNCSIADRACAYPTTAPSSAAARHSKEKASEAQHQNPSPASSANAVSSDHSATTWTPRPCDLALDGFTNTNGTHQHNNNHHPVSAPPTPQILGSPSINHTMYATPQPALFTAQHMMLLHHAETNMDNGGVGPPGQIQQLVDISIRRAIDAPYLMDSMLAFSALHLASQLPDTAHGNLNSIGPSVAALQRIATELQTRSVASFTRLTSGIAPDDTETCVPRFLFSSVLSLHSLAETLTVIRSDDVDFHSFVDRFVDCVHLHRGVRTVIQPIFQFLVESELRPLLDITSHATPHSQQTPGSECVPLQELLQVSDLGDVSLAACRSAVDSLQWAFDLYNNLPDRNGPHAASAFSVIVHADYVDVLRKYRPEALVILAYYAVLLHRCRRFWMFRDAGARMIRLIAKHLGSYWRKSMAWPLQVIEIERD